MSLKQSEGYIDRCILKGGKAKENWPCLFSQDSKLRITSSMIQQSNYNASLFGKNSTIVVASSVISSMLVVDSNVEIIDRLIVDESIEIQNSKYEGGSVEILGLDNGYINLFVTGSSNINLDKVYFGRLSDPNIKVENTVSFNTNGVYAVDYDEIDFLEDSNGDLIILHDLQVEFFEREQHEPNNSYTELNKLIGLENLKKMVKEFIASASIAKRRQEAGLPASNQTLHALFLGNPGTGKTTVARLLGKILYEEGIIKTDTYIEVSRPQLVGEYIGQTALKTRTVLESALGGVLFIDEAYTLVGKDRDFGREAINEILSFMENHRNDMVIIFAGYNEEMMKFLDMNAGLRSRIPHHFIFEDYTIEQLIQLGSEDLVKQQYTFDQNKYTEFVQYNFEKNNDNSNGRWIRNLNENLIRKASLRMQENPFDDISYIKNEDMELLMNS